MGLPWSSIVLKEKALEPQRQNQNASSVSIIRDLIEKDRQE